MLNRPLIATDNAELESSGNSFLKNAADFVQYGILNAVTSASIGVYNTVAAGFNYFGADLAVQDEKSTIYSVFGRDAAMHYEQNKVGTDFGGLVLSSVITGLGAVKAVRAIQAAGAVSADYTATLGIANSDIVLGSKGVQAYRAAVAEQVNYSWTNPKLMGAMASAARQNVIEAAAAEGAFILSNNQNALLNPDQLDYVDSSIQALKEGWMFALGGAAFGTVVDGFRIKGYAAQAFKDLNETGNVQKLRLIGTELEVRNGNLGDRLHEATNVKQDIKTNPEYAVTPKEGYDALLSAVNIADTQLTRIQNDVISKLNNAGSAGVDALQRIIAETNPENRLHLLGNLTAVEQVTLKDFMHNVDYIRKQGTVATPEALVGIEKQLTNISSDEAAVASLKELNNVRMQGATKAYAALGRMLSSESKSKALFDELAAYAQRSPEFAPRWVQLQNLLRETPALSGDALKAAQAEYVKQGGIKIAGTLIHPDYADDFAELLSDVATHLGSAKTGYVAVKKFPIIAKLLDKTGVAALRPFNATSAWYNVNTGAVLSNIFPRAQDIGTVTASGDIITVAGIQSAFQFKSNVAHYEGYLQMVKDWQKFKTGLHPALEVSAHWAAAAQQGVTKEIVQATDLPRIEAYVTNVGKTTLNDNPLKIMYEGKVYEVNRAEARDVLLQQKEASRAAMQAAGRTAEEISVVLNTDMKYALGHSSDGAILMDRMDYTKAEHVKLKYKAYDMKEVDQAARTFDGLAKRIEIERGLREKAAIDVMSRLGVYDKLELMPAEDLALAKRLSQTEQKAGLLTSAHTEFNSLRSFAANVGSIMNTIKDKLRLNITDAMHAMYEALGKVDNFAGRAQLSLFLNLARRKDFHVVELRNNGEYSHAAIDSQVYRAMLRDMQKDMPADMPLEGMKNVAELADKQLRDKLSNVAAIKQIMAEGEQGEAAMLLSPDVGSVVSWHMKQNAEYIRNDRQIAQMRGSYYTADPAVFYPPPRSIKGTPFVAFVKPVNPESNLPSYMLYGATQAELDSKIAYAAQKTGKLYRVVDRKDVTSHKRMKGEYEKGKVFNEWDFDSTLRNMGKASDYLPNPDAYAVENLDLLRNWHHNKTEFQAMAAVELKYADTIQSLRGADDAHVKVPVGERVGPSSIYEDTVNIMLDKGSEKSAMGKLYTKVQDAFDVIGSKVLDNIGGQLVKAWRKARGRELNVAEFERITKELEKQGFENPYSSLESYLSRSVNISDNRSAAALSRVFNTMVAGLTLRLDPLNSFIQAVSTPILLSAVVREALVAAPPPGRTAIAQALHVMNPVSGVAEPSANKVMANALKTIFTDEGKALAEQGRKRGILTDETRQFLEAADTSSLNGRHTIQDLQKAVDKVMDFGSKISWHRLSEDFTRRWVMNAMWDIAKKSGLDDDAAWAMVRSGVDKVHGIYRAHSRVQLFNGTIGQSIGLFQTYMFNMAQYLARGIQDGRGKDIVTSAVLQSSIFGIRSLPGFGMLNNAVAQTNSGNLDIYSLAGSEHDPSGIASYFLYGAGSNMLIIPTDAYSRGDIAIRHSTVLPLNPLDWPAISIIAKAITNIYDAAKAYSAGADAVNAVAYGLAHNSLNRPLQGIGVALLGNVTTQQGTPLLTNSNFDGYSKEEGFNWAALGARILGGKPKTEAIALDSYYRRVAYQSAQRAEMQDLGESFRIASLNQTKIDAETYTKFLGEYMDRGGNPENFNGFVGRNYIAANQATVDTFKSTLENSSMSRLYGSLLAERRDVPVWQDANAALVGQ